MNMFRETLTSIPTAETQNGAPAYSSTGSEILNLFVELNKYEYDYNDLAMRLTKCWAEDPIKTVRLIAYGGAITRTSKMTDLPIKGAGLKCFRRMGMKWLYTEYPEVFYKNIIGFAEIFSFADLWHKDFVECWVNNNDQKVANYLAQELVNNDLARKFLPRYKSKSNIDRVKKEENKQYKYARNKGLRLVAEACNLTIPELMKLKTEGTAHTWQQAISASDYKAIDFNKLPGKVLSWITRTVENKGSFLGRHGLENAYIKWLDKQKNLKVTSFIHELVQNFFTEYDDWREPSKVEKYTINKQVQTIIDRTEEPELSVLPLLDTSGSMKAPVGNTSALNVCLSLGVFFSMINKGAFADMVAMFDDTSRIKELSGDFVTRCRDIMREETAWGSTSFSSAIELLIQTKKRNPNIPDADYPDVLLVCSDMAFNDHDSYNPTHEHSVAKLKQAGIKVPIFCWWNISSNDEGVFQNRASDKGVMYLSGFDPAIVTYLMSGQFKEKFEKKEKSIMEITPQEVMEESLSQEYLELFTI